MTAEIINLPRAKRRVILPPPRPPMETLGDLTKEDRESLATLRKLQAMVPNSGSALTRLLMRICNDYPSAKAWALFWREVGITRPRGG